MSTSEATTGQPVTSTVAACEVFGALAQPRLRLTGPQARTVARWLHDEALRAEVPAPGLLALAEGRAWAPGHVAGEAADLGAVAPSPWREMALALHDWAARRRHP